MNENKVIRIGFGNHDLGRWQAQFVQTQLKKMGWESILYTTAEDDGVEHTEALLLENRVDVAVHALKDLPTNIHDQLVISAVSYREAPGETILAHKRVYNAGADLRLIEGSVVGVSSPLRIAQLRYLNKTLIVKDIIGDIRSRINKLREDAYDAIIVATAEINWLKLDCTDFERIDLHPKEFIPLPAQGVLAYKCRKEDFVTRKILNQIHNRDVSLKTNVERKVLQLIKEVSPSFPGVYCEQDAENNYHVYAALKKEDEPLVKVQVSQSASVGLAENVFKRLKTEN